ncbi:helix-turn-helix domain-containing protein [Maribacter sp. 4G9]|uniref:helix-turn-helix domain-containing protein n=1 Tax=Maribacter sp. 4G9 TaxID=1889777 RepID=UPI000C15C470|nr:helix-turn-helix domain-containing protein [Maribacter sp. 4G9]PIB38645.1 hypothetical protein BFP75_15320 [Maribacter sp. 4G9]
MVEFSDEGADSKRLDKAKKLLRNSQASISEIAYDCGFNDPGIFHKLFKKATKYHLAYIELIS